MAILSVTELTKKYGNHTVIDNISFSLDQKKCIALIGPNGAGKTTALRMITRLIHPTAGSIHLHKGNEQLDDRYFIGYLPQHPVFYPWMTGMQFLKYCAELTNISTNEATKKAEELFDLVGLRDAKHKRISTYSGGMKQRLGIAQAIIHDPKLLILDEPVSALDPIGRRDVLTLMQQLKEKMTILFSTHILNDADQVSDEVILLHEGTIVESGSIQTLREKYQSDSITLSFEEQKNDYVTTLQALDSVQDVRTENGVIRISVSDLSAARQQLLQLISQKQWPITNFSIDRATLEDMFMKVVNERAVDDNVS